MSEQDEDKKVSVTTTILESQKAALLEKAESVSEGIREAVAAFLAPATTAAPADDETDADEVVKPVVWENGTITLGDVVYVPVSEDAPAIDPESGIGNPFEVKYPNDHQHLRGPDTVSQVRHGGVTTNIKGCAFCGKPLP